MVGSGFAPGEMETRPPVANPFGIERRRRPAVRARRRSAASRPRSPTVGAGAALIVRLRRSRGVERQQLKWFAYVASLIVIGLSLATLSSLDADSAWPQVVGPLGWFTALIAAGFGIPVATAFAILRHRLYDIDVVIKRTLVYGVLTATLAVAYLASVLLLQFVFSPSSDLAIAASRWRSRRCSGRRAPGSRRWLTAASTAAAYDAARTVEVVRRALA